jgi:2-polyprenyl-3-methyl-5-hydroxy-6-metoxy-1,4-benzoquinol methylase
MATTAPDIRSWEQAEIARSRSEASHTPQQRLLASEANVQRYMTPPATTAFPLEYVFHLLGDVSGKTVLDLGCGSGENSILLARRGARVIGLDVSEALLALARQRFELNGVAERGAFIASSAHDLALPDASVDVVVGIAILHHLDLDLTASEVRRVLKPGGRAIFQEPVRNSKVLKAIRSAIPYRSPDVSPFERPLTDPELARFASGFTGLRRRNFWLPFVNAARVLPFSESTILRLCRFDAALLRNAPVLERYAGVRVFEIRKSSSDSSTLPVAAAAV